MFPYTHIVWDFNGTLYDDLDATIRSVNRLLSAHGLPELPSRDAYRKVFGFPIEAYYRRIGFDFSVTSYEKLAVEWVDYYNEESKSAKINPDALTAWRFFDSFGCRQIILSATQTQMLRRQVASLGVSDLFSEVLGKDTVFATGKEEIAHAFRERNPDARILVLGDTDHDAAVADRMGADCVLLSCGHQGRVALEKTRALAVADSLAELAEISFWQKYRKPV